MRLPRLIGSFSALISICAYASDFDFSRYEGLSGQKLADAVRVDFKPLKIIDLLPVGGSLPPGWPQGWWPAAWPADASRIAPLVPHAWTDELNLDLYNLVGGSDSFIADRASYIPGELVAVTSAEAGWEVGFIEISGIRTNGWSPSPDRRGDLARRLMYMALIYPAPVWRDVSVMLFADGSWPLLTTYGRNLLLKWNADDPVDSRERDECLAIASAQGNWNPFVVFSDLPDYLWGEKVGQPYVPEEKRTLIPLKARYSRAADKFIDFYSPYVADGASWFLDGEAVDAESVELGNLPDGEHIVSYTSGSEKGKVKIIVTP